MFFFRKTEHHEIDGLIACLKIPVRRIRLCQCATAIDVVDHFTTTDDDVHTTGHIGLAATTEDAIGLSTGHFYTGIVTVGSLVASAENIVGNGAAFNHDRCRYLRCTVDVVTAKQIVCTTILYSHRDGAIHMGSHIIVS